MRNIVFALALCSGCVGRGTHELVEVQLDATRTALRARTAQCQKDLADKDDLAEALKEDYATCEVALEVLAIEKEALQTEVDAYREELAAVLAALPPPSPDLVPCAKPPRRRGRPEPCLEPAPEPDPAELAAAREAVGEALILSSTRRVEQALRDAFHADVALRLAELVDEGKVELFREEPWVVVRIDSDRIFNEGRLTPSPRGKVLLDELGAALRPARGWRVRIEGHTDARPQYSAQYASNWERGFAAAMLVHRYLEDLGVRAEVTVASHAGTRPLDPAGTPEAHERNRRVELFLMAPDVVVEVPGNEGDPPGGDGDEGGSGEPGEGAGEPGEGAEAPGAEE